MLRVLQVVTDMGRAGIQSFLMNYYREVIKYDVQFDFLTYETEIDDYEKEIASMGGRIFRIPRLNPLSIRFRNALSVFFSQHSEYNIVHVHLDCMSGIILKAAQKHQVALRIAHSHSSSQSKNLKYPIKLFYKHMIPKYATRLLACGKDAGEWMFGKNRFYIIHNAINSSDYIYNSQNEYAMRKELGISKECLVIGFVGNFSAAKNHSRLVEIFYALQSKIDARLLLIGSGVLEKTIKEKVHGLNIQDRVYFLGKRSDVPFVLQAIDVFVMPSLFEGTPVSVIEAQAAGIPCIISNCVPDDCMITDRIKKIGLDKTNEHWVQQILNAAMMKKEDTSKKIVEAGYDIVTNAKELIRYYSEEGI